MSCRSQSRRHYFWNHSFSR